MSIASYSAGFNAIRTAHNPASRALLDACDRIGMLVLNEAFDVWSQGKSENDYSLVFAEDWQTDLREMIVAARNHPSVIMYSTGNESIELASPAGAHLARLLASLRSRPRPDALRDECPPTHVDRDR